MLGQHRQLGFFVFVLFFRQGLDMQPKMAPNLSFKIRLDLNNPAASASCNAQITDAHHRA